MLNPPILAIAPPERPKSPRFAAMYLTLKVAIVGYVLLKLTNEKDA